MDINDHVGLNARRPYHAQAREQIRRGRIPLRRPFWRWVQSASPPYPCWVSSLVVKYAVSHPTTRIHCLSENRHPVVYGRCQAIGRNTIPRATREGLMATDSLIGHQTGCEDSRGQPNRAGATQNFLTTRPSPAGSVVADAATRTVTVLDGNGGISAFFPRRLEANMIRCPWATGRSWK